MRARRRQAWYRRQWCRAAPLLQQQAEHRFRRQQQRLAVGQAIEANILEAAGSFKQFQRQLVLDNFRKARH
mgnify:CR=1 FL=1